MSEICENCGAIIGQLEPARIWSNHVVCDPCYQRLNGLQPSTLVEIAHAATMLPPRKNKGSFATNVSIVAMLFAFILCVAIAIALWPPNPRIQSIHATPAVPLPPTEPAFVPLAKDAVEAPVLTAAYARNEVRADQDCKGQIFQVRGVIDTIGKDVLDTPYITLRGHASLASVQCMFRKSDEPILAAFDRGQEVVIQGQCSGRTLGLVLMRDCRLAR